MKLFLKLSTLLLVLLSFSCSSDDDNSEYPITLNFKGASDNSFKFYENGTEKEATPEVIQEFSTNSQTSINVKEFENAFKNDYYKFLSDTEIEISEEGEVFKANYIFKNGYLFVNEDDELFLYGQGDKEKLEYRFYSYNYNRSSASDGSSSGGGGSSSYEDEGDIDFIPATFENLKNAHRFESIEDIKDEDYLIIQNVSFIYSK